ncbi:RNA polymerase sigma factor [Oceanobacillus saliphilus]|uniref:RNA polymerase sigma factor n=1 Tax=Oceanobacillus saliphilus TaxID=2925834 RepID=UPI00201E728F|nr:RNA polymerase sigma factor [Oceanobacillus saliphilus]
MAEHEVKLIKKIKKGNQQAFKKLYDRYADYSLRTVYAITNNTSDASDIVQETFIKVYRNIDSYNTAMPFKPWFYQILINESRRYMKKKSKEAINSGSEQLLDHLNYRLEEEQDFEQLESAMDQLGPHHRTVLVLKYLNGFSEKEIAEVLELNVNTVKSRLYKARQQLKAVIGGAADE